MLLYNRHPLVDGVDIDRAETDVAHNKAKFNIQTYKELHAQGQVTQNHSTAFGFFLLASG